MGSLGHHVYSFPSRAQSPESKCPPQPATFLFNRGVQGLRSQTTTDFLLSPQPRANQTRLPHWVLCSQAPKTWREYGGNLPSRAIHAGLSPGSTGCVTLDKLLNLSELCCPLL